MIGIHRLGDTPGEGGLRSKGTRYKGIMIMLRDHDGMGIMKWWWDYAVDEHEIYDDDDDGDGGGIMRTISMTRFPM